MNEDEELKAVQNFIYDDGVQKNLSAINNHLMEYNILEITGIGTQEIRHSNILAWLFGDNEHNLEYRVLDGFLKKVIDANINSNDNIDDSLKKLRRYIYLPFKKKDIVIYREYTCPSNKKKRIDLLIVDKANKVIVVIENKVFSSEGEKQLKTYEEIISEEYKGYENKYYIFLTPGLDDPSENTWLKVNYEMIAEVIRGILEPKTVEKKTKIIMESYIDSLARHGIIKPKNLEKLCKDVWKNHKEALEIIENYRPSKIDVLINALESIISNNSNIVFLKLKVYRGAYSFYLKAEENSPYIFKIWYSTGQGKVSCRIVTAEKDDIKLEELRNKIRQKGFALPNDGQHDYNNLTYDKWELEEDEISEEEINGFIQEFERLNEELTSSSTPPYNGGLSGHSCLDGKDLRSSIAKSGEEEGNEAATFCESIWKKPKYKSALEVLYANKLNKLDLFRELLKDYKYEIKTNSGVYNFFVSFGKSSPLWYRFIYNTKSDALDFVIVTKNEKLNIEILEEFDREICGKILKLAPGVLKEKQYSYFCVTKFAGYFLEEDSINEKSLEALLDCCKKYDESVK